MPSSAFTRWLAYARVEPFGEGRADLRTGILAALMANVHRDPKTKPEPFTPGDFMPDFNPAPKPSLGQRLRAALSDFMAPKEPRT